MDAICQSIIALRDGSILTTNDVLSLLVSRFGCRLDTSPHDELIAAAAELGIEL
jgi:hypothetical protein